MSEAPCIAIPETLFACAESSSFSGVYDCEKIAAGPDDYRFKQPLSWEVAVTNTGDALLLRGSIKGVALTHCARCLDEFSVDICGEIEGYFLLSDNENTPQDMNEDEFDVLADNKIIALKPLLDAAILLELALIPLCSEDCRGLCSQCGQDLNEADCACMQNDNDFEKEKNPFSVLKNFSFE